LAGDDILDPVAAGGQGRIQQALDINFGSTLQHEPPVVSQPWLADLIGQRSRDLGQDAGVVSGVV